MRFFLHRDNIWRASCWIIGGVVDMISLCFRSLRALALRPVVNPVLFPPNASSLPPELTIIEPSRH